MQPSRSESKQILKSPELKVFNARSNWKGLIQLARHFGVMGVSGYLWAMADSWLIKLPALIVYGFCFAAMFAPLHESSHRTAFANNRLNDTVAWIAGLLSFYNSDFYRRYHKWHHRYAQVSGKDPELDDPKPNNLWEYLVELSGWNWWVGKFKSHYRVATGQLEDYFYIAEDARDEVIRSTRLQLAVYAGAIALSLVFKQSWFFTMWLLPLAVGQPILRYILLAEHTGCTNDDNPLTNTRTTRTWFPFMVWNIPFHAEHHLYPSIPFHALPQAHQHLKQHFEVVEHGYVNVHRDIVSSF